MPRALWKGAVSFGLVHIPVSMYPASEESGIDFDWLDKRTMDPVGYKRVNKRTGKEIDGEHVVKGIKQEGGDYVVLSDAQIKAAYPKATQTIEIEAFVKADQLSFSLLEKPYFLEPVGKSDKVYALLREAMIAAGVIGIARIILHTKEHLAALMPSGSQLVLNTLRWAHEMRSGEGLKIPAAGPNAVKLKPQELKMAAQLIKDMMTPWEPEAYTDHFTAAVQKLVAHKLKTGDVETVTLLEADDGVRGEKVVDLTKLLEQSLGKRPTTSRSAAIASAKVHTRPRRRSQRRA